MACPYHPFRTVFAFQKFSQNKFPGWSWKKFFQFICDAVESVLGYWQMFFVNIRWLMSRFKAYWSKWNITASFRNYPCRCSMQTKNQKKIKNFIKKKSNMQYAHFLCMSLILFWLGNRLGFNLEFKHWILAKNTMQFGTPAKLGQQWDRRQNKPRLLSQRPLAAANGGKEGKKGKYSPRVKGILHRAAVNTETPGVFHQTQPWKACPEGGEQRCKAEDQQ